MRTMSYMLNGTPDNTRGRASGWQRAMPDWFRRCLVVLARPAIPSYPGKHRSTARRQGCTTRPRGPTGSGKLCDDSEAAIGIDEDRALPPTGPLGHVMATGSPSSVIFRVSRSRMPVCGFCQTCRVAPWRHETSSTPRHLRDANRPSPVVHLPSNLLIAASRRYCCLTVAVAIRHPHLLLHRHQGRATRT